MALCAILNVATGELEMASLLGNPPFRNLEIAFSGFEKLGVTSA